MDFSFLGDKSFWLTLAGVAALAAWNAIWDYAKRRIPGLNIDPPAPVETQPDAAVDELVEVDPPRKRPLLAALGSAVVETARAASDGQVTPTEALTIMSRLFDSVRDARKAIEGNVDEAPKGGPSPL